MKLMSGELCLSKLGKGISGQHETEVGQTWWDKMANTATWMLWREMCLSHLEVDISALPFLVILCRPMI